MFNIDFYWIHASAKGFSIIRIQHDKFDRALFHYSKDSQFVFLDVLFLNFRWDRKK